MTNKVGVLFQIESDQYNILFSAVRNLKGFIQSDHSSDGNSSFYFKSYADVPYAMRPFVSITAGNHKSTENIIDEIVNIIMEEVKRKQ